MNKKYKAVSHIGRYSIVGTQSIFVAAKAIKHLQNSENELVVFNSNKRVSIMLEDYLWLEIWEQSFYRENH